MKSSDEIMADLRKAAAADRARREKTQADIEQLQTDVAQLRAVLAARNQRQQSATGDFGRAVRRPDGRVEISVPPGSGLERYFKRREDDLVVFVGDDGGPLGILLGMGSAERICAGIIEKMS